MTEIVRVYRVEHKQDRRGCFTDDVWRIPGCNTTHACARMYLRSMPTPAEDFFSTEDTIKFSPQYIFAFPTLADMRHWIGYKYRKAMVDAGFVVGVYDVRKVYNQSDDQVMYTRRVADHVEDLPLIKQHKDNRKVA